MPQQFRAATKWLLVLLCCAAALSCCQLAAGLPLGDMSAAGRRDLLQQNGGGGGDGSGNGAGPGVVVINPPGNGW